MGMFRSSRMTGRRCRVWWPKHLSLAKTDSSFLLGWFVSSSPSSLDVVVAFSFSQLLHSLQGLVDETDEKMPVLLQERSNLCVVGQYGSVADRAYSCGCNQQHFLGIRFWINVLSDNEGLVGWIPRMQHIHWNGDTVFQCHVHLIFYETPTYGAHHFSLRPCNLLAQATVTPMSDPKWVQKLNQEHPLLDLDTVILAINSAAAAEKNFNKCFDAKNSYFRCNIMYMFLGFIWKLLSLLVASLSTLFYVLLQFLYNLLASASDSWTYFIVEKVFSGTWINMRIRFSQILYWPIFLQENGMRSQSSVEYEEKAALIKHSMWSSLAVDVLLGNFFGFVLLYHAESVWMFVLEFSRDFTNELLRSGCVWLMGVPAGFKLNTELAGVLGMISLTAIQIWSTIWIFLGVHFLYVIRGLAISGIIFGLTIPAALIIDLIALVTLHVSTLHWLISLLYLTQIQALAALWRLFRGQKWNPLRQRLDSYENTVKQHIVGSLLFTPLLLLLPTTSVFYIFFSIVNTTISLICILIEVTISIIHATPYMKVFLWLVRPRRFPSGIWFEIQSVWIQEIGSCEDMNSPAANIPRKEDLTGARPTIVVSFLHSNFLTVGQIILPHYTKVLSEKPRTVIGSAAYGVLTGRKIPSRIGIDLPTLPWMMIPCKEFWGLCYTSILKCYKK